MFNTVLLKGFTVHRDSDRKTGNEKETVSLVQDKGVKVTVQPARVKVRKGQDAVFRCDVTEDGVKVSPKKFAIRWSTAGAGTAAHDNNESSSNNNNDDDDVDSGLFGSGDEGSEAVTEDDDEDSVGASVVTFNDTLVISNVDEVVQGDVTCFVIKRRGEEKQEEKEEKEYVGRATARLEVIGMLPED